MGTPLTSCTNASGFFMQIASTGQDVGDILTGQSSETGPLVTTNAANSTTSQTGAIIQNGGTASTSVGIGQGNVTIGNNLVITNKVIIGASAVSNTLTINHATAPIFEIQRAGTAVGFFSNGATVFSGAGNLDIGINANAAGSKVIIGNGGVKAISAVDGLVSIPATTGKTLQVFGTDSSTTSTTGTVIVGDGSTAGTNVSIGGGNVTAGGNISATGTISNTNATGITTLAAATQDAMRLQGRAGGTSSFIGTLTPTTLTASRTYTFPDATGTVPILSFAQTFSALQTFTGGITVTTADVTITDRNVALGTTTGTKFGTATTQKLGFYNATPVVQQATTGTATGFTANAGTAVQDASTFTGGVGATAYRISDIVLALKNLGLLAQ